MKLLLKTLVAGYVAKKLTRYYLNHRKPKTVEA